MRVSSNLPRWCGLSSSSSSSPPRSSSPSFSRLALFVSLVLLYLVSFLPITSALQVRAYPTDDPSDSIELDFAHRWALFGPHDPDVSGSLILFDSLAASLDLPDLPELCSFPPFNATTLSSLSSHIFLILRSDDSSSSHCNFDLKVNISQALGARAVIIANIAGKEGESEDRRYGDQLISMKSEQAGLYNLSIDSVFVTHSTYLQLKELYDETDGRVEVTIGDEMDIGELGFMRQLSIFLPFAAALSSFVLFIQNLRVHRSRERRRERDEELRIREMESRQQQQDNDRLPVNASITFIPDPSTTPPSSSSLPSLSSNGYSAVAINEDEVKDDEQPLSDDDDHDIALEQDDVMDELFDATHRSCSQWLDDRVVQFFSSLAKPRAILVLNGLTYLTHIVTSLMCLYLFSEEKCSNDLHALSSLFFCRAVIGMRIAYWQCHSSTPTPSCHEVFIKNWCDYVFLFTGSIQVWSSGNDCAVLAPHLLHISQGFVLTIYATFAARIVLFIYIRLTILHQSIAEQEAAEASSSPTATTPPSSTHSSHLLSFSRALLDIINGGFYCAGPLDTARPATPLDLRSLPTLKWRPAMARAVGGGDAASCSICMMEYETGEVLRLLYCNHVFHKVCVDQWLVRNATCPMCRATVDKEKGEEMVKERRQRRERRRRRRERHRQRREDEDGEDPGQIELQASGEMSQLTHHTTALEMV